MNEPAYFVTFPAGSGPQAQLAGPGDEERTDGVYVSKARLAERPMRELCELWDMLTGNPNKTQKFTTMAGAVERVYNRAEWLCQESQRREPPPENKAAKKAGKKRK